MKCNLCARMFVRKLPCGNPGVKTGCGKGYWNGFSSKIPLVHIPESSGTCKDYEPKRK